MSTTVKSSFVKANITGCDKIRLQAGVFAGIEDVEKVICSYEGYQTSKAGNCIATLRTDLGQVIRCMGARLIQAVEDLNKPAIAEIVEDELVFKTKFYLTSSNNDLVLSPIAEKKEETPEEKLARLEAELKAKSGN